MMDIARLHINDAMTEDGNITIESITRGAAMLARKFVNEFVVYNDISLTMKTVESIQFLEQSAQKKLKIGSTSMLKLLLMLRKKQKL